MVLSIAFLDRRQDRQDEREIRQNGYLARYGSISEATYRINGIPPGVGGKIPDIPFFLLKCNDGQQARFCTTADGYKEAWEFLINMAAERNETLIPPVRPEPTQSVMQKAKRSFMSSIKKMRLRYSDPESIADDEEPRTNDEEENSRPAPMRRTGRYGPAPVRARTPSPAIGTENSDCPRHNPNAEHRSRSRSVRHSVGTSSSMVDSARAIRPQPPQPREGSFGCVGKGKEDEVRPEN